MSAAAQRAQIKIAAQQIAPLLADHRIIITHGNGPQVGMLAAQSGGAWPLDNLDAQSEGMIGYEIELALSNATPDAKLATLLTQVLVDPNDPAFDSPTKPIGAIYAEALVAGHPDWTMKRDTNGWRRVVASPAPKSIVGLSTLKLLMESRVHIICLGGGGIPVARDGDGYLHGVEAVIDKDAASALLAIELGADALIMLTDVPAVMEDFGTPNARPISDTTPLELSKHVFPAGSMGPKVEAAIAMAKAGRKAAIGALDELTAILRHQAGTWVTGDKN
jgi:carbamate kinase